MKRNVKGCGAIAMSFILGMVVPLSAYAEDINYNIDNNNEKTALFLIDEVEECMDFTSGEILIEDQESIIELIGGQNYDAFEESVNNLNELLASGELEMTESGTIYEVSDDELVVQGGNVDKVVWHWWGITRYANYDNASTIAYKYNKYGNNAGMVCSVATVLAVVLPSSTAKVVAGVVGGEAGFFWAYWCGLANDISYYNKIGRGVAIKMTWILAYSVSTQ